VPSFPLGGWVAALPLPLGPAASRHHCPVDAQSCAESPSCGDGDDVPWVPGGERNDAPRAKPTNKG